MIAISDNTRACLSTAIERTLITIGVACLGWCGVVLLQATAFQHQQHATLTRMLREVPEHRAATATVVVTRGGSIGVIEIPRLHLSVAVIEGDSDAELKVAVGHLPDTPLPWETGNSVVAAHRDTFFRRLEDVRLGDVIHFRSPRGQLDYIVRETLVVNPRDVWVLNPTPQPMLTLITCYPFSYLGRAPYRFIVRAERVSVRSDLLDSPPL